MDRPELCGGDEDGAVKSGEAVLAIFNFKPSVAQA